jgi:hypothetical protein
MLNDVADYDYELNGEKTGITISILKALESDEWDYVTLQQASALSWKYESYIPFIDELARYVRNHCKKAKILIHQTWAYQDGSEKLNNLLKFKTSNEMFIELSASYEKVAKRINAYKILPCGKAMQNALKFGIKKVHRDTYHASLGVGRYLLALVWYKALTGKDISQNSFNDFDEPISNEERKIIIKAVNSAF